MEQPNNQCQPGECVRGWISGELVAEKDWETASENFLKKVDEFNTTHEAIPHPGFVVKSVFCMNCGHLLPESPEKPYGL